MAAAKEIGRGLQEAFIGTAYEKIGQAFTDTGDRTGGQTATSQPGMDVWRKAGESHVNSLLERHYTEDFMQFKEMHVDPYTEETQKILNMSQARNKALNDGLWTDAEGNTLAELDLSKEEDRLKAVGHRGELYSEVERAITSSTQALSYEATKYGSNPHVRDFTNKLYASQAQSLAGQFNPASMANEQAKSGLRVDEANIRASDAQASSLGGKAKKATEPMGAWTQYGPQGIAHWYAGAGSEFINDSHRNEAKEEFALQWKAEHPEDASDEEKLLSAMAANAARIEKMSAGKSILAQLGPQALEAAAIYNPHLVGDKPGDRPVAVTTREPNAARKAKVQQWKKHGLDTFHAYMDNTKEDVTKEQGIDYVMNEWLQKALTGKLNTSAYDDLTASEGQQTAQYRSEVYAAMRPYLESMAGKTVKGTAVRERKGLASKQRGGPGLRTGSLSRTLSNIFTDKDVYPVK